MVPEHPYPELPGPADAPLGNASHVWTLSSPASKTSPKGPPKNASTTFCAPASQSMSKNLANSDCLPSRKHVCPPWVLRRVRHVVRDDVDKQSHAMGIESPQ